MTSGNSLPSFIVLNGSDYFQVLLDYLAGKRGRKANVGHFVIDLQEHLKLEDLRSKLMVNKEVLNWIMAFRLKRRWPFQLPIWVQSRNKTSASDLVTEISSLEVLFQQVLPSIRKGPMLRIFLFHREKGSSIALTWNHSLMDAHGIELLCRQLGRAILDADLVPDLSPELPIGEGLKAVQKSKEFLMPPGQKDQLRLGGKKGLKGKIRYQAISFSESETDRLNEQLKIHKVRFGRLSYLLAGSCIAFSEFFAKKGVGERDYWIPVPQDRRKKGAIGPVVSNQVSFLFFREKFGADFTTLLQSFSKQMIDQMRERIPQGFFDLMHFSRRLPRWYYARFLESPTKGAMASYFFSDTGESLADFNSFAGIPIADCTHYPPVGPVPGFTLIFMNVNRKLKLVIGSYSDGSTTADLEEICKSIKSHLLQPVDDHAIHKSDN